MSSWYTRGSRPDRNIEAAAFGAFVGFLDAWSKGKPRPWLYAATKALGAATAMDEHRLLDRAHVNERNQKIGETAADVLNKVMDVADALPAAGTPALPVSSPYATIVAGWNQAFAETQLAPLLIEIPTAFWQSMTDGERTALTGAANRDGVELRVVMGVRIVVHQRQRIQ